MANGAYRFPSGAAGHHYFTQPSSNNSDNMYNNNNSHLLNGGGPGQFGLIRNINNKFQPHQSHPHQSSHHSQHQDASHGHSTPFSHHQQSHSSGGGLSNGSHFTSRLQNGSGAFNSKDQTDHMQDQIKIAHEEREMSSNHPRARTAYDTKTLLTNNSSHTHNENETQQRQRPGFDPAALKSKDQYWTKLDMAGQQLRVMALKVMDYQFLTELYMNNNKIRIIPPAIKQLRNLRMLDLSLNDLTSLPPEIGMLVNLTDLRLVDNKLMMLPYELGNLFQCKMLALEGNPLKDIYFEELQKPPKKQDSLTNRESKDPELNGSQQLLEMLREHAPPPPAPNERGWIVLDDDAISEEDKITIINYNTLCQHYCSSQLYGYTPIRALAWEHRKEVIMDELKARDADIMCLQEVEGDAFETFFRPQLAQLGYLGWFVPKTRVKTMSPLQAKTVDGCAIFWRNSKFHILEKQSMEFAALALNRPDMKGAQDVYNRVMPKDNIAVVCYFENRVSGARLIVVNAHLHWDQLYKDVKVVQVAILLDQIERLSKEFMKYPPLKESQKKAFRFANSDSVDSDGGLGSNENREEPVLKPSMQYSDSLSIPLILCGDFNSLPDSGPYELLSKGELPPNHSDIEGRNYGTLTRDGITHPFHFDSAYGRIGELPLTNYVSNFRGVVDYIWYAKNSLSVRGLLGQVDQDYIDRVPGFPNVHFPSDHVALMAEFGVKKRVLPPGSGRE